MKELLERLKHLGLNTNEAKVYLALLKQHPATGYEISKLSGLPQARAYETLKSLEAQQIVVVTGEKPQQYTPVPPKDLLNRYEDDFKGAIDYLRQALPIYSVEAVEPVHNLTGPSAIIAQVSQLVEDARHTIFMEVWHQDAPYFEPALKLAHQRGVSIHVVAYGDVHYDFATVHPHGRVKAVEEALGGRWLIMSVDNTIGLVGTAPYNATDKTPLAVWTKNPAIVMVVQQLIIHDIYLLDVEHTLPNELEEAYGKDMFRLRKKLLANTLAQSSH